MSIAKNCEHEYGPAPEDSKDAVTWLERHGYRFQHFIGGGWQSPAAGEYFDSVDPSNGEKLASVAQGSAADVDAAVKGGAGQLLWMRALTPHARARYLYAIARWCRAFALLAVLETMDNGKPIREVATSIFRWCAAFLYHAAWANFWSRNFRSTFLAESSDKLFRGTFRCSCSRGNRSRAGDGNTVV